MAFVGFLRENARWLGAGALLTFSSSYGQTFFISLFAGEIRAEFGLSHGDWGGIYAMGTMASAAVLIWTGALTDRFRVRAIGPITLFCLALACLAMAVNSAVWILPIIIFALRQFGQGMATHIAVVAMARWFHRTRGRAMAVANLGYSFGEALLPVIFVSALAFVDWRLLWGVVAVMALAAIPALRKMLTEERSPRSVAEASQSVGMLNRHWTRAEVLKNKLFWFVFPSILAPSAFVTAFFFQQVHLAEVKGWAHIGLVALFPLFTAFGVVSMMLTGWAIDRVGTARLMPVFLLPLAAGFVVLGMTNSLVGASIALALLAFTSGAQSTLPGAFWAEFFGTMHLGAIKAMATAAMVLGSALGPAATGFLIDQGIGFDQQAFGIAAIIVAAAACVTVGIAKARRDLPRTA